jgi:hypothetical protein
MEKTLVFPETLHFSSCPMAAPKAACEIRPRPRSYGGLEKQGLCLVNKQL